MLALLIFMLSFYWLIVGCGYIARHFEHHRHLH